MENDKQLARDMRNLQEIVTLIGQNASLLGEQLEPVIQHLSHADEAMKEMFQESESNFKSKMAESEKTINKKMEKFVMAKIKEMDKNMKIIIEARYGTLEERINSIEKRICEIIEKKENIMTDALFRELEKKIEVTLRERCTVIEENVEIILEERFKGLAEKTKKASEVMCKGLKEKVKSDVGKGMKSVEKKMETMIKKRTESEKVQPVDSQMASLEASLKTTLNYFFPRVEETLRQVEVRSQQDEKLRAAAKKRWMAMEERVAATEKQLQELLDDCADRAEERIQTDSEVRTLMGKCREVEEAVEKREEEMWEEVETIWSTLMNVVQDEERDTWVTVGPGGSRSRRRRRRRHDAILQLEEWSSSEIAVVPPSTTFDAQFPPLPIRVRFHATEHH